MSLHDCVGILYKLNLTPTQSRPVSSYILPVDTARNKPPQRRVVINEMIQVLQETASLRWLFISLLLEASILDEKLTVLSNRKC